MNQVNKLFAVVFIFGTALLSYGCSNQEFAANAGSRSGANLSDGKKGKTKGGSDGSDAGDTDGDDSGYDAGIDGGDDDGKNGGIDGDEDSAGNDDDDDDNDGSNCQYLADDFSEKVANGPDLEITPKDFDGHFEDEDYVFTFDAWQGAMGATAQLWEGRGPVIQIGGGVDLPDYPAHLAQYMPKDADHWQLTPVMTNGVHKYGVKHSYQGVIKNAKDASCTISLTETIEPFLDRTGGGCFALTTNIRLANGKDTFVALLNVGDELLNPVTGKAAKITAITSGPEADQQMIRVGYGASKVRVTQKHPMQTAAGLKQARHLTKADRVLGADGAYHAVTELVWLPVDATQVVRNIIINPESMDPRDHMVLADGIVTGDLYLQRQLEKATVSAPSYLTKGLTMVAAY